MTSFRGIQKKKVERQIAKRPSFAGAGGDWGTWEDRSHVLRAHPMAHSPIASIKAMAPTSAYVNRFYSVQVCPVDCAWGAVRLLMIRRHDAAPLHDHWAVIQRIKRELVGPDALAMELYPPQGNTVDIANMYHLWVMPTGFAVPFTLASASGQIVSRIEPRTEPGPSPEAEQTGRAS